ncbi:hypothetical protein AB0D67_38550 [Streptosporangium sp. NPDC048047]|uniref:hypothetical protein n=1 Tax=Streptosporangium sp. NPDC048047 TaxID=3155748 RepID=UPI003444E7A5
MYEIRDDLGHTLARVPSADDVDQALDDLCAMAHAQAAASGEGATDLWLRLVVIDTATSRQVAFRHYNPDPGEPYEPLTLQEGR